VIDAAETHATAHGGPWGAEGGSATINGNAISWNWTVNKWSMTVQPGGKTAQIVSHYPFGTTSGMLEKIN
jgi:hypothetical protein